MWQVSMHTPIWVFSATRSSISRSSSNRPPTSEPLPDMVSSSTVVCCSGFRMAFSVSAIWLMPTSMPCSVWLPGWKL